MATRTQNTVGSAAWVENEKENVLQLLEQEKEEIIFPAQHELEWLNEHMAEIFSKNQFNVTDVFKTPGKLRGKTPRTARKRNVQEPRMPLTDVFASNPQSMASPRQNKFSKQLAHFEIARDPEADLAAVSKPYKLPKQNTDSGYHGMTEDEMDVDVPSQNSPERVQELSISQHGDTQGVQSVPELLVARPSDGRRTTEGSFHSAKEEQIAKIAASVMHQSPIKAPSPIRSPATVIEEVPANEQFSPAKEAEVPEQRSLAEIEREFDDIGSPSDGSTPDRPLVRKSSLTFASLPAREPLTTKMSIGSRISRTSQIDQTKLGRNSYIGRLTGGTRSTQVNGAQAEQQSADTEDVDMDDLDSRPASRDESDAETRATRLHNKSSTQRLHEKIDMLGKSQPSRHSKSIPNLTALTAKHNQQNVSDQPLQAPAPSRAPVKASIADDDDDWIKPLNSPTDVQPPGLPKSQTIDMMEHIPDRGTVGDLEYHIPAPEQWYQKSPDDAPSRLSPPKLGHMKSASTATLVSPEKAATAQLGPTKPISVSNPAYSSTTPYGSPKRMDGPISASKSKLQSIMKTAKGLFTSSAGVSAAAKMETLTPSAIRMAAKTMPGLYPNVSAMLEDKPLPRSPSKESRKTRSSTEREREEKRKDRERQKVDDQLDKAREIERQKAAEFKAAQDKLALARPVQQNPPIRKSPRRQKEESVAAAASVVAPTSTNQQSTIKANEAKRPVRPTKETLQRPKPPTVAIRVGTMSQRILPSTNALASNLQETLQPPASKPATITKKPSTTSLNTNSSNGNFKSSVSSQPGKPKALILAAQKKEQEERAAQQKAEQKRETERKRTAQQDEARRQEQRQRAEADRQARERAATEDAKRNAQKQAFEKRRQENVRKAEQQRNQNAAADLAASLHKNEAPRPPSRMNAAQPLNRSMVNHPLPNPAKPVKRALEDESAQNRQQAPRFGAAAQQTDSKRRRTEEENVIEVPAVRPTMAPPVRQSNTKPKSSILPHGYTHAPQPPPISQTAPQLYGNNQQGQSAYHQQPYHGQLNRPAHPMEMAKYANNKIVFADAPNQPSYHPQNPNPHKTPTATHQYNQQPRSIHLVKSSPAYQNGENISLPEIPTDSEDSDSDASPSFPVPAWASPSALQRTLMEQDSNGVDADVVFGPIAPLRMEEIFAKGTHKDRLKRLRDRTSSAAWVESGDILTRDEVEKDKVAREKIRGEGGWRMGIS